MRHLVETETKNQAREEARVGASWKSIKKMSQEECGQIL
jgi:hypothetical protein